MTTSFETLLPLLVKQYLISLIRLSQGFARLHVPSALCYLEKSIMCIEQQHDLFSIIPSALKLTECFSASVLRISKHVNVVLR